MPIKSSEANAASATMINPVGHNRQQQSERAEENHHARAHAVLVHSEGAVRMIDATRFAAHAWGRP